LFENTTRYVFTRCLAPAASVFSVLFCAARIDVGVVLSCFYVLHWYVCLYAVGLVECASLIVIVVSILTNKVGFKTEVNMYK
jgi:hypothetical protein